MKTTDTLIPIPQMRGTRRAVVMILTGIAFVLSACDFEEIRVYTAPKDPPRQEIDFAALAAGTSGDAAGQEEVTWDVPAEWTADEVASPLLAGWAIDNVRITVSRLEGEGGGAMPNINRWRGQLSLQPLARLEDQPITPIDIAGNPAALVDLVGSEQRIAAILYPRTDQNATWFLKMTGPPSEVDKQLGTFTGFARSVRFKSETKKSNDS